MMKFPICRGRISHSVLEDLSWLIKSLFVKIDSEVEVSNFEKTFSEYVGRKYCVAFPFARTGIYEVLRTLNLPSGSVVLMPPITIKPILDVVLDLGLVPKFVDIDKATVCFSENELEDALSTAPRVAILTYLFGIVPNVEKICQILKNSGVFVIEDFSQCLNGQYRGKRIGTFGDVSVYSASSVKTLDTYGGGLVLTDSKDLADSLKHAKRKLSPPSRRRLVRKIWTDLVRNVSSQPFIFGTVTFPIIKALTKRSGSKLTRFTGDRSQLPLKSLPVDWFESFTSLQAQVGIQQIFQMADKDRIRVSAIEKLNSLHQYVNRPTGVDGGQNVYWQYIVYTDNFEKFQNYLYTRGIDCATTSLVKISGLKTYQFQGATPNADELYSNGAYLPCNHYLTSSHVMRIGKVLSDLASKEI